MIRAIIFVSALICAPFAVAAPTASAKPKAKPAAADAAAKSDDEKTVYAWGYIVGQKIAPIGFSASEAKSFVAGLADAMTAKTSSFSLDIYGPKIGDLQQQRVGAKAAAVKKKGAEFAEKFSSTKDVKPIAKGGWYQSLKEGTGAQPKPEDTVQVDYRGTLIDGTEFDSSYKRGQPTSFPLGAVIPCWTNGVAMMKVGGKAKLVCPSDVAYGDAGHPPTIPGGATLVFEVELHEIVKADAADAPKKR